MFKKLRVISRLNNNQRVNIFAICIYKACNSKLLQFNMGETVVVKVLLPMLYYSYISVLTVLTFLQLKLEIAL